MKTVTLMVPDDFELDNQEVALLVATRLYEKGRLSLGQAADLVGLTKTRFAEILGNYDVSLFNYPASELSRDIANA
jgi:predicted HTH domain antitoxin